MITLRWIRVIYLVLFICLYKCCIDSLKTRVSDYIITGKSQSRHFQQLAMPTSKEVDNIDPYERYSILEKVLFHRFSDRFVLLPILILSSNT